MGRLALALLAFCSPHLSKLRVHCMQQRDRERGRESTGIWDLLRCLKSILALVCAERKDIKYPGVGEEIQGIIEGVQNYGVFVKIRDDIKAMLHGSEMASKNGREPDIRATFAIGDEIKVRSPCCIPDVAHPSICRHTLLCHT